MIHYAIVQIANYPYGKYLQCHMLCFIMLSVIFHMVVMLSVINLSAVMINVVMLNAIAQSAFILNVILQK